MASGEGDYSYPNTLVWFVFEGNDDTHAVAQGMQYFDILASRDSASVQKDFVSNVTHGGETGLYASAEGPNLIRDILLKECRSRDN